MTTTDQGAVTVAHKSADHLVRINGDANDFLSFSGDEDDNGLSMTQHRYYRWGVNCVVAIGEMNRRNQWDDQAFDEKCATLEARLASVSSASAETPERKETLSERQAREVMNPGFGSAVGRSDGTAWNAAASNLQKTQSAPEPVPATNQAGEVERLREEAIEKVQDIIGAHYEGPESLDYTVAEEIVAAVLAVEKAK